MGGTPTALDQAALGTVARRGVRVPTYDRACLRPRIVHVGVGGFHRAHLAAYTDNVAEGGGAWGILGLGLLPADATMAAVLARQDHLYTLVEKGPRQPQAAVIGSIVGFLHTPDPGDPAAAECIAAPATAILSMTVTEAGYAELPAADRDAGLTTSFDRIAAGLHLRRERGAGPLAILSCDNLPGNGAAARQATLEAAGRLDDGLRGWVEEHCSFPSSMVDRITPVTSEADRSWLRDAHGLDDGWPVVAEPFRQWVLEDDFPAGRPAWEQDGALFTDRVHDWELYKLRLLNAGHSSMAYLAALAGITYVDEAMGVPEVRGFLDELLHAEALPTLAEIPGHPRSAYITSVFERFANTGVRDQISRLCLDGSAKFPTFLIPTIAGELERGGPIRCATTALAGWARYLGVMPREQQAFDAAGDVARGHADDARADPLAFLRFGAVFPPSLRDSPRFRAAFSDAYRLIVEEGPLAALAGGEQLRPARDPAAAS